MNDLQKYRVLAARKERLFAPLLIIPFNPAKIAVVFLRNGERSKEFHKPSLLHLWSTPLISKKGVGKHYLNRTTVLNQSSLFLLQIRIGIFNLVSPRTSSDNL